MADELTFSLEEYINDVLAEDNSSKDPAQSIKSLLPHQKDFPMCFLHMLRCPVFCSTCTIEMCATCLSEHTRGHSIDYFDTTINRATAKSPILKKKATETTAVTKKKTPSETSAVPTKVTSAVPTKETTAVPTKGTSPVPTKCTSKTRRDNSTAEGLKPHKTQVVSARNSKTPAETLESMFIDTSVPPPSLEIRETHTWEELLSAANMNTAGTSSSRFDEYYELLPDPYSKVLRNIVPYVDTYPTVLSMPMTIDPLASNIVSFSHSDLLNINSAVQLQPSTSVINFIDMFSKFNDEKALQKMQLVYDPVWTI